MNADADLTRSRLELGLRGANDRSVRNLVVLIARLVLTLGLLMLLARSTFDRDGTAGTTTGSGVVPGTALIEPVPSGPNFPLGMFQASTEAGRNGERVSDEGQNQEGNRSKTSETDSLPEAPADEPQRTRVEDLPFLLESLVDLDRDLPPALYFHFLDKARHAGPDRLIADARRDVTFSHLYRDPRTDPARYRGQLIGLRGTVRRAVAYDIEPNAYGLTKRYELWIFTEDSGKFPWVVELTTLPDGFPLGTDIQERVETAGYFLKLWAYRAQDGFRSAPLLLGHGLVWQRSELIRARFDRQFAMVAFGFLGAFAALLAWAAWRWNREDRLLSARTSPHVYERLDEIPRDASADDGSFSSESH